MIRKLATQIPKSVRIVCYLLCFCSLILFRTHSAGALRPELGSEEVYKSDSVTKELSDLTSAMYDFRMEFGLYPPAPSVARKVKSFVRTVFPDIPRDVTLPELDEAQALVFWLSRLSKDVSDPFKAEKDIANRRVFFKFDEKRIRDGRYYPPGGKEPYVLFVPPYDKQGFKGLKPYQRDGQFYLEDNFQIIAPGADGEYGKGGEVTVESLTKGDLDNETNFATGPIEKLLKR